MESIKILEAEHDNISSMLDIIKYMTMEILTGNNIKTDHFRLVSSFISEYADGYHHDKEEKILFQNMLAYSGSVAKPLIENGMLVEHDLARYYNRSLKTSLDNCDKEPSKENLVDILTFSLSYRDLLTRHIEKENSTVFTFAERSLDKDKKRDTDNEFNLYEKKKSNSVEIQLNNLKKLQDIYL